MYLEINEDWISVYDFEADETLNVYEIEGQGGTYILTICWKDELNFQTLYLNNSAIYSWFKNTTEGVKFFQIRTDHYISTGYQEWIIDYFSVYCNGVSLTTAKAFEIAYICEGGNFLEYYLITITMIGNLSVYANEYELFEHNWYNGTYIINKYDSGISFSGLSLIINATSTYNISSFSLEGCSLNHNSNKYPITFEHSNVLTNESYFYSLNSRLYYNLISDDDSIEYIYAEFNIENELTLEKTFCYVSSKYNSFNSEIRLLYDDSKATILPVRDGISGIRAYLPSRTIDKIGILITDDDLYNDYSGVGYFSHISIDDYSDTGIEIITSSVMEALIPLLFLIFLPAITVVFSINATKDDYYIQSLQSQLFLPFLALFTATASFFAQIEIWQVFLMCLGFLILFIDKRDDY